MQWPKKCMNKETNNSQQRSIYRNLKIKQHEKNKIKAVKKVGDQHYS